MLQQCSRVVARNLLCNNFESGYYYFYIHVAQHLPHMASAPFVQEFKPLGPWLRPHPELSNGLETRCRAIQTLSLL